MADAEVMANRLVSAGVPCELQVWERQVHVFQAAASWVPEARAAIAEIGVFMDALATAGERATAGAASEAAPTPRRRSSVPATAAPGVAATATDGAVGGI